MVKKKPTSKKTKSKPPLKPAKKIVSKEPKASPDSLRMTLETVVDKLNEHGDKMNQLAQNIVKIDQDLGKIRLDNENRIIPLIQELGNKSDHLNLKIDEVEDQLNSRIEEVRQDLKFVITGSNEEIQEHGRRISALESRPA